MTKVLQKKIFSRYVQQKLTEGNENTEIKDLISDLKDGILLIKLLVVLSGNDPGKLPKPSTIRIQQVAAAAQALKFAETCGVDLKRINIQPEDLIDGREKEVLGLIFQIIVKFMRFDEDEERGDVREVLTRWLQNRLAGYEDIKFENFTKSFHDGMIFNALIHKMRPRLVDMRALSPENKEHNLNQALRLAQQHLGVEQYLQAADIPKLDELGMIVYLGDWYSGMSALHKQDIAARRVGKLMSVCEQLDRMQNEYTDKAQVLVVLVDGQLETVAKRDFVLTLAGIKESITQFGRYQEGEKARAVAAKLDINTLMHQIFLRRHKSGMPSWTPPTGLSPAEIEIKFQALAEAEKELAKELQMELAQRKRLLRTAGRFKIARQKIMAWISEKAPYFKASEQITNLEEAEDAIERLHTARDELDNINDSAFQEIQTMAEMLIREEYEEKDMIEKQLDELTNELQAVTEQASNKRFELEAAEREQRELNDAVCRHLAQLVQSFSEWLKGRLELVLSLDTQNPQRLLAELANGVEDDAKEVSAKIAEIEAAEAAIEKREVGDNPHTNTTSVDIKAEWQQYGILFGKRKQILEEEAEIQSRYGLTKEEIKAVEETFVYFDKNKDGALSAGELRTCMQSLGEPASKSDIAQLFAWVNQSPHSPTQAVLSSAEPRMNVEQFKEMMGKQLADTVEEDQVLQAFNKIAKGKDHLVENELADLVNERTFKQAHLNYIAQKLPKKSGNGLDYVKWTTQLFGHDDSAGQAARDPLQRYKDVQGAFRKSAIIHAARFGDEQGLEAILAENPTTDFTDAEGRTALMHAARRSEKHVQVDPTFDPDMKAAAAASSSTSSSSSSSTSPSVGALLTSSFTVGAPRATGNNNDNNGVNGGVSFADPSGGSNGGKEEGSGEGGEERGGSVPNPKAVPAHSVIKWRKESAPLEEQPGKEKVLQKLLGVHVPVNARDAFGRTALMEAAKCNNEEAVMALLAAKADIDAADQDGCTAVIGASANGSVRALQRLLEHKADPNIVDGDGRSALLMACNHNNIDIVSLLLSNKANINYQDKEGRTAVMEAAMNGHLSTTKKLLASGGKADTLDQHLRSALSLAAECGYKEIVEYLGGVNPDLVNQQDKFGRTATIWASREDHFDVLCSLINLKADPALRDNGSKDALTHASDRDCTDVIPLLKAQRWVICKAGVQKYFWNTETQQSSWNLPAEATGFPLRVLDQQQLAVLQRRLAGAAAQAASSSSSSNSNSASNSNASAGTGGSGSTSTTTATVNVPASDWKPLSTPEGYVYYWNSKTNEVSWTPPK